MLEYVGLELPAAGLSQNLPVSGPPGKKPPEKAEKDLDCNFSGPIPRSVMQLPLRSFGRNMVLELGLRVITRLAWMKKLGPLRQAVEKFSRKREARRFDAQFWGGECAGPSGHLFFTPTGVGPGGRPWLRGRRWPGWPGRLQPPMVARVCFALFTLLVGAATSKANILDAAARLERAHATVLDERRESLAELADPFEAPRAARTVVEDPRDGWRTKVKWKYGIAATVFWIGEQPTANNPTPNTKSAWDPNWVANFGGYDDPFRRQGYVPADFKPQLNPFYVALPYNDVAAGGVHRPEAQEVIPWFWLDFRGDGISVCKGRWVEIHFGGKICYAQWEDVGPFATDHWGYVFGDEAPRPNLNQAAGIDVSPAVRDFLGLRSGQKVDWRFAAPHAVPDGPWKSLGISPP